MKAEATVISLDHHFKSIPKLKTRKSLPQLWRMDVFSWLRLYPSYYNPPNGFIKGDSRLKADILI
jgi:hypothetical protein